MTRYTYHLAAGCLMTMLVVSSAAAQTTDPSTNARVRFGPLAMRPTLSLTNLGVDTNVFNEAEDPKSDFTLTVTPQTDMWLRLGRAWLTMLVKEDLVYFKDHAGERSANSSLSAKIDVPLNRLSFAGGVGYLNTRERPGYEIDARVRRTEIAYTGSADVRVLSKTFIGVTARQTKVDFDKDARFFSTNLNFALNRTDSAVGLAVTHRLTPLTRIIVTAERQQDRFEVNSLRDSDSNRIGAGIHFDPFALVSGVLTIGYRDFTPSDPTVPAYTGMTAAVDLSYTILGTTKLTVGASRDLQYSFAFEDPYYLQTGFKGSVTQQVAGPFDVVARGSVQRLAYRSRLEQGLAAVNRTDSVHSFGGGFGYRVARDLRVGFNADKNVRTSTLSARTFDDLSFGTTVTYGF